MEIRIRMIMTLTKMFTRVTPITIPATAPLFKPAEMYINNGVFPTQDGSLEFLHPSVLLTTL